LSTDETDRPAPRHHHLPLWVETILLLAVALLVSVLIKTFFAQVFYVPSASMEPGLIKNDRILVEKPSYWFGGTPRRGDVVVFSDPGQWLTAEEDAGPTSTLGKALVHIGLYPAGGHLVKRVIGVAGDTVTCCDGRGRIEVNGHPLDEGSYVQATPGVKCNGPEVNRCTKDWSAGPVPPGDIFVMGDNRADSADSAYHLCHPRAPYCGRGPAFVPVSDVVGRVEALLWPAGRFHFLHRPGTFAGVPDASSSATR
jgi:signal peptidase I